MHRCCPLTLAALTLALGCGGESSKPDPADTAAATTTETGSSTTTGSTTGTTAGTTTGTSTGSSTTSPTDTATSTSTPPPAFEGCLAPQGPVLDQRFMIKAGGMEREYRLTVPDFDPETPHPLVIAIHGADGRGFPFNQQPRWEELARDEGIILAYPQSELVRPNEGEWQLNTREDMMHDIDFMNALIDEISNRHCVDAGRVYATGYSLGSMFNYELACHMNDRFAAIASVAGTMPVDPNACDIIDPVPILHVHGRRDPLISYTDEWDWKEWDPVGTMRDIPGLIDYWGGRYGCGSESSTELEDSLYVVMDDCDNPDVRVEHHMIREGNHDWPLQINGTSTHLVLWDFMRQFSKP